MGCWGHPEGPRPDQGIPPTGGGEHLGYRVGMGLPGPTDHVQEASKRLLKQTSIGPRTEGGKQTGQVLVRGPCLCSQKRGGSRISAAGRKAHRHSQPTDRSAGRHNPSVGPTNSGTLRETERPSRESGSTTLEHAGHTPMSALRPFPGSTNRTPSELKMDPGHG